MAIFFEDKKTFGIKIGSLAIKIGKHRLPVFKDDAILILEPGGFGDYLGARPYYKYIKTYFRNSKIVYICKDWIANFVKAYDKNSIDEVIPFNYLLFDTNKIYRESFINYINGTYRVAKYVDLAGISLRKKTKMSRFREHFAKYIKAKEKIISYIRYENETSRYLNFFNKKFELNSYLFRQDLCRQFFQKWLSDKIPKEYGYIEPPKLFTEEKNNIAISLRASTDKKSYPPEKWIIILNQLKKLISENSKLIFLGGLDEQKITDYVIENLEDSSNCINLAGNADMNSVPLILNSCKLMISMESGNTHLAHYLKMPVICIASGEYYGNCLPYPDNSVDYIFPDEFDIQKELLDKNELIKQFYFSSPLEQTVYDISPEKVLTKICEKL